jgi:TetR/AcrR family acrAB operon transcriptional repressor
MRRTKEDAEASRRIIIDTAYKFFLEKGYAATNLDDIAKAIKMTRGVIYWHFKSKLDLFLCLINEALDESFNNAKKIYESEEALPEKFKGLLSKDEIGSRSLDLLKSFHPGSKDLDKKTREATLSVIRKKVQTGIDLFVKFISKEQDAGNFRKDIDPEVFIAAFMLLGGILHAQVNKTNPMPLLAIKDKKRNQIVDLLWNGFGSVFETK